MRQIECAQEIFCCRRLGLSLLFTAALTPMALRAEPPWRSSQLACDYQDLSLFDETEYQMSDAAAGTVGPERCVIGHWSLESASYEEAVSAMASEQDVVYDEISAVAEIIVRESGIAQSCTGITMRGTVQSRGVEGDINLTMSGPTMTLLRLERELVEAGVSELLGASPYRSHVIMDGMTGVSVVTIAGNTFSTNIDPDFAAFPVASDVVCTGSRMTITSFPDGVDNSVTHRYIRVR